MTDKSDADNFLTTNQGVRISDNQNSLKAGERGPTLMEDFILREKITHFDHERIPERIVHARGSAAHGYFQVYECMKEYTRAKFLQDPSVKTPVFVRFSTVGGSRGSADTVRDVRGFATKFYTEEGNYDLVGNNMPVFFIQDAIKFPDFVHSVKPEPLHEMPQASSAHDNFWDFISLTPESMHMIMWLMSDRALPRSYASMEGFGVHTFRLINEAGKSRFVKFHWKPLNSVSSLLFEECQLIAGRDPDFNRRDLWESIEMGIYPEYEFGVQILEENEVQKVEFDIFDPTKLWPEEDVPVKRIGKMVLNRNPDNFFAETEQAAFHPGHLVPGIDFSNDPLLQGRLFSYLDTQLIRLGGPNFHEIPINRPKTAVANNQRDGYMRQTVNKGNINYEPSSLGTGCPMQALWSNGGFASFPEQMTQSKIRKRPDSFGDHYSQASLFWNSMSLPEQQHIIGAFTFELSKIQYRHIREKMLEHLVKINFQLAEEVAKNLALPVPKEADSYYEKESPALSLENLKSSSIKGRRIAILVDKDVDQTLVDDLKSRFEKEQAVVKVISKSLGNLPTKNGGSLLIECTYLTTSSVFFDAVVILNDLKPVPELARLFIQEAYRHCKPIAAIGSGAQLLSELHCHDNVVIAGDTADPQTLFDQLKETIAAHRYWERSKDES